MGDLGVKEQGKSDIQTLPVEHLQRGKYQPRKDIDPERLQELAESIKSQGIVQPIVVREVAYSSPARAIYAMAPREFLSYCKTGIP
jgi:ParB family chromosome partitioning protein